MPKIIKYYRRNVWGKDHKYIHPDNSGDASIIAQLTGKKTIDSITIELIRDLTEGRVNFVETIAP